MKNDDEINSLESMNKEIPNVLVFFFGSDHRRKWLRKLKYLFILATSSAQFSVIAQSTAGADM